MLLFCPLALQEVTLVQRRLIIHLGNLALCQSGIIIMIYCVRLEHGVRWQVIVYIVQVQTGDRKPTRTCLPLTIDDIEPW